MPLSPTKLTHADFGDPLTINNVESAHSPFFSPTSPVHADAGEVKNLEKPRIILGIIAMDIKARSKAMREILIRLVERARGAIEVKVFGDKVILDEGVFYSKSRLSFI